MKTRKLSNKSYDCGKAEQFWSRRLASTNPLAAVLTYNAPPALNRIYDEWERQNLLASLGASLRGKRVLDIGAGMGRISLALARKGAEVIALDNSRAMLDKLVRSAIKDRVNSRVTTVHAPSHQIPLDDRAVDIVICFGLLEHLPETERQHTVTEAARVLKKNGRMLVVVNNLENQLLKTRYPLKRQTREGYFVTLVGLAWLNRVARSVKMRVSVLAANPGYALTHYLLEPNLKPLKVTAAEFRAICHLALRLDLEKQLPVGIQKTLASHFLVELKFQKS